MSASTLTTTSTGASRQPIPKRKACRSRPSRRPSERAPPPGPSQARARTSGCSAASPCTSSRLPSAEWSSTTTQACGRTRLAQDRRGQPGQVLALVARGRHERVGEATGRHDGLTVVRPGVDGPGRPGSVARPMLRIPASRLARPPAVAVLLAVLLAALAAAPGRAATTRLRPSADGSARATVPAARGDRRRGLVVDGAPAVRSWLRFEGLRGRRGARPAALRHGRSAPRRGARARRGRRVVGRLARGRRGHWATIRLRRVGPVATRLRLTLTTRSRHRRGFASRESPHAAAARRARRGRGRGPGRRAAATTASRRRAGRAHAAGAPAPGSVLPARAARGDALRRPGGQRRRDLHGRPRPAGASTAPTTSPRRARSSRSPGAPTAPRRSRRTRARPGRAARPRRAWRPASPSRPRRRTVTMPSLAVGATYGVPGPAGVAVVATADRRLRRAS